MRLLAWLISSVAFLALLGFVGVFAVMQYFGRDLPEVAQLENYEPPVTTRLHAADGRLMAEYAVENRVFVPIEAIPDHVIQAFISAEDQHFYGHPGIDVVGIVRAAYTNLRNWGSDRRLVGASTITQQVAKNFLLTNEVSIDRKIREILLALRIERAFEKNEILELYLNEIYLGRNSYGVAAAAMNYFNKSLPELTLAEAAYLAALPKAPNNYHPIYLTEAAVARRDYVLQRMVEDEAISTAQASEAASAALEVFDRQETEFVRADYFAEQVRRELQRLYGDEALYGGGLTVRTSMEPRLQEIARRTLREGLIAYDRRHGWRGPLTTLATFDAWPSQLAAVERPAGAGAWRLAVALEIYEDAARIGLADRSQGMIPMDELRWARPWRSGQRVGAAPTGAADVLALGDVVLVEPAGGTMAPSEAAAGTPVDEAGEPLALPTYGLRQIPEVQGAIVAMDPHTGRVLAMSGGFSYEMSEFNRATQALRQPGSAFKPFVYLTALDQGFTPSSIILDTPIAVEQGAGLDLWRPSNYSHDYLGPVPLRVGVEKSRNIMTVRLLLELGLEPVRDIAQTFGVYEDMMLLYSMALGAGETTPASLTNAYAMIANGGYRIRPLFIDRIQDRHGRTVFRSDRRHCEGCAGPAGPGLEAPELPDDRAQVADPVTVYQMVSMLHGVVQRGTGARLASLGLPLAGKTGTTNNAFDTWFVGFSPDLACGVFIGFDEPRTLGPRETGSSVAAPIFGAFMGEALEGQDVPPFRVPPGVSLVRVDPATGALAAPGGASILEAFRPGTEPASTIADLQGLGTTWSGQVPETATQGTGGLY